jgi:hypothetical protein
LYEYNTKIQNLQEWTEEEIQNSQEWTEEIQNSQEWTEANSDWGEVANLAYHEQDRQEQLKEGQGRQSEPQPLNFQCEPP